MTRSVVVVIQEMDMEELRPFFEYPTAVHSVTNSEFVYSASTLSSPISFNEKISPRELGKFTSNHIGRHLSSSDDLQELIL